MPSRQYDRTWVLKISRKFETKIVVFVVFVGLFHALVSVVGVLVGVLGALISVLKISGFCRLEKNTLLLVVSYVYNVSYNQRIKVL